LGTNDITGRQCPDHKSNVLTAMPQSATAVCFLVAVVNAGQLERVHLPQHQVSAAGQRHEVGACRTKRRSIWFAARHWRSRIVWYGAILHVTC